MCLKHAFRSGMSRYNDMQAAIAARAPFGAVAGELVLAQVMLGIPKYLKSGGAAFIDSGAFTAFRSGEPMDFDAVLRTYETIADMADECTSGLYVVSPDAVGDQQETLRLLTHYRTRLLALIDTGCNLVVPIQRGAIPANDMLKSVKSILGTDKFVAGIPSNEEAMSIDECATIAHHAFHILGRVQMNDEQVARIKALRKLQPDADITADANWMRSRIDKICQHSDAARTEMYLAGGRTIGKPAARTVALTRMIQADTQWGVVMPRKADAPVQQSLF